MRDTSDSLDSPIEFEYDVCLSFAGEDRSYVEDVARELRSRGVRVFYDKYERANLWGKDLYEHLDNVYRESARFCVLFVSAHYARKLWTTHERKSAQARAFRENEEYILPARLDQTEVPGLRETVGYVDAAQTSAPELAELVVEKLDRQSNTPGKLITEGYLVNLSLRGAQIHEKVAEQFCRLTGLLLSDVATVVLTLADDKSCLWTGDSYVELISGSRWYFDEFLHDPVLLGASRVRTELTEKFVPVSWQVSMRSFYSRDSFDLRENEITVIYGRDVSSLKLMTDMPDYLTALMQHSVSDHAVPDDLWWNPDSLGRRLVRGIMARGDFGKIQSLLPAKNAEHRHNFLLARAAVLEGIETRRSRDASLFRYLVSSDSPLNDHWKERCQRGWDPDTPEQKASW